MRRITLAAIATALAALSAPASAQHEGHGNPGDSAAVVAVVSKYHAALTAGDSAGALALLTDDAVILETGGMETRDQYRSHHLPGDINFAKAIKSERGPVHVRIRGDVAWTTGTSTTQGEMNGRTINSRGAELMVLVRTPQGWKISAIHWSSGQRRAGG
jgi:ketosteroid isomerase-like protein